MSALATASLYFLSCASGAGLFLFAIITSLRGAFSGPVGVAAPLAIFVGSFALITMGLFVATAIWIIFDASRDHRPKILIDFVEVLDIKGMFRSLMNQSLAQPVHKSETNNVI